MCVTTVTHMHNSVRPTYTIPSGPAAVTLAIRLEGVEKFKRRAKAVTDSDFAKIIGIDQAQVSRVLAGKAAPGPRFIAGAIRAFGYHSVKELFAVVPVPQSGSKEAA